MNNFPKGNDLIVKWAIKYSDGTPFPLENYAWELCYSAGRGINVVKDTAVISVSDNLLTWRFSGKDQVFYGKYSLTLRLYQQGKIVATVSKNNAFELSTTQYDGSCDIDLVSYCDNISLQDALLRGNKAMEVAQDAKVIAGSAVNTAGAAVTTANEAKSIANTANATSTEAKTIAGNAKTVADQAKTTADATAATATQKAEEVAQKEAQLEAALNNLSPDQSGALALSTKVNEHGEKLSELEKIKPQVESNTQAIDGIAVSGGASVASAVIFNNGENAEGRLGDRVADESQMGYVVLRKGVPFAEQVTQANTIYEIRYDFDLNGEEIAIKEGCILKFDGGSLNNGKVDGNNCFLIGNVKLKNIDFTTPIGNTKIYASWFGAKGDGKTDDSKALKQMITAINKNGSTIVFNPNSVYIHGDGKKTPDGTGNSYSLDPSTGGPIQDSSHPSNIGRDITLRFINYSNLTIIGNGATIASNKENGECKHNCILFFGHCTNVYIENLNIDGQKEYINPVLNDYNTGNDWWDEQYNWIDNPNKGYALRGNMYITKCSDFKLNSVSSNNSIMDGICISGDQEEDSHNIILTNCICKYNYRQGLTLSTVNRVSIFGGEYSYTGLTSKGERLGISPMAGIDIEADSYKSYNILISNASFVKNYVSGIAYDKDSNNIKTTLCYFEDKGISIKSTSGSNNEICYNEFYNCGCGIYQKNLKVLHNIFKFDANSKSDTYTFDTNDTISDPSIKSYFESNIIDVNLDGISENMSINGGGIRITEDRDIIVKNNILKNITNGNNLPILSKVEIAENNQIILETDKYPLLKKNVYSINVIKKAEGNTLVGNGNLSSNLYNRHNLSTSPGVFSALIPLNKESLNKCYKILPFSFTIIVHTNTIYYKIVGDYNTIAGNYRVVYFDSVNGDITELPVICRHNGDNIVITVDEVDSFTKGYIAINLYTERIKYGTNIYTEIPSPSNINSYRIMINGSKINNIQSNTVPEMLNGLNVYDTKHKKFLWAIDGAWVDINGRTPDTKYSGETSQRPILNAENEGFEYYDSTLKKKILWNGVAWTNIDGTALE